RYGAHPALHSFPTRRSSDLVLGFIGVKLILEALHTNSISWINGGEGFEWAPEVPIWLSLTVIVVSLAVGTIASLVKSAHDARKEAAQPAVEGGDEGTAGPRATEPEAAEAASDSAT